MNTIIFNLPPYIGTEDKNLSQAIDSRKICGDGEFTKKCNAKFEEITGLKKVLMTTSGTSALEMAALLADIKSGENVIVGANAVVISDFKDASVVVGVPAKPIRRNSNFDYDN